MLVMFFWTGIGRGLHAMLLGHVALSIPYVVVVVGARLASFGVTLEEAAATAGVRPLARVLGIVEPLVRPASVLAFALVFVLALREIDTIVLLSGTTILRKVYTMIHFQRDEQVAALCILLIVLQGVVFLVLWILRSDPMRGNPATSDSATTGHGQRAASGGATPPHAS